MSDYSIVAEWLRYAQNDLVVARHCIENLHPKQTEIAGYHCQQCAHLTPYGVTSRYPDELAPDENMAKLAVKEAQQVYDLAAASCLQDNSDTDTKN